MADIAILEHEVGALKNDVRDMKESLEDLDEACTSHSDRLLHVEVWQNGNGAKGAEVRLQGVEHDVLTLKECLGASQTDEAIERIASAAARSIVKGARDRDKTAVEKMKAVGALLGPILSATALVAAAIIAAVAAT